MTRSKRNVAVVTSGRDLAILAVAAAETKAAKFKRLANIRAGDALLALNRIGNLGTPAYEYTDAQIDHLNTVITGALKNTITKLRLRTRQSRSTTPIL